MKDVNVNDRPLPGERVEELTGSAFAGEYEPVTVSLLPLRDLGKVTLTVDGPARARRRVDPGDGDRRRLRPAPHHARDGGGERLHDRAAADHAARRGRRAGGGHAHLLADGQGAGRRRGRRLPRRRCGSRRSAAATLSLPLRFTVRKGTLDPVDIPAGPWSHTIDLPWFEDEAADWNRDMAVKSLKKLREYGFTTASGLPVRDLPRLQGRRAAARLLRGDAQMKLFKETRLPHAGRHLLPVPRPEHLLPGRGGDAGGRLHRLQRVHQGGLRGGAEARRRGGLAAGLLEHRRRADRRRRGPQRRERRGVPQGVPQGAALLHGRQLVHGHQRARTRTSGCRRRCTWPTGTCTTRRG